MRAHLGALLLVSATLQLPQQPTFRSGAQAVLVDVSVESRGKVVDDLDLGDFSLIDDGVPQTLLSCSRGSLPLDLVLLEDRSVSMDPRSADVAEALSRLSKTARPEDRVTVVSLASAVHDKQDDRSDLAPDDRHTSLFDGIAAVFMRTRPPGMRRVVVAITDGVDTSSVLDHGVVSAIAERTDAVLYAIVISNFKQPFNLWLDEPPGRRTRLWTLEDIADHAGGRVFDLSSGETLDAAVAATVGEFHSRYTIGYQPTGVRQDGWHPLTVRVTRPGRFELHFRKGYSSQR